MWGGTGRRLRFWIRRTSWLRRACEIIGSRHVCDRRAESTVGDGERNRSRSFLDRRRWSRMYRTRFHGRTHIATGEQDLHCQHHLYCTYTGPSNLDAVVVNPLGHRQRPILAQPLPHHLQNTRQPLHLFHPILLPHLLFILALSP